MFLGRIDFEPKNGKYLAYPDKQSVILLNSQNWTKIKTLSCDDISSNYSIVQFSPCGNYLVASTVQGDFVIFEVNSEKIINKSKHANGSIVCGLVWNPISNFILNNFIMFT